MPHSGHADQWVRLPAWGFLLVFYSNQGPRMHRFDSMGQTDRQTDGQSDGSQLCLHRGAWVQKPTILKLRQLLYVIVIGVNSYWAQGLKPPPLL